MAEKAKAPKSRRNPEPSDAADFTPEHDRIMVWLASRWRELIEGYDDFVIAPEGGALSLEPCLREDYQPNLFPDALGRGAFVADHRQENLYWNRSHTGIAIHCAKCNEEIVTDLLDTSYVDDEQRQALARFSCPRGSYATPISAEENKEFWATLGASTKELRNEFCLGKNYWAIFEIKPKINSLGAVIRQLKLYEQRIRKTHAEWRDVVQVILVTPDRRFDDVIEQQGITVFDPGWDEAWQVIG